jgi:ribosomal protein S18 acetylase RimI-like enzyme
MLRPVTPQDSPRLVELAADTGFFRPMEIETLDELLADFHRSYHEDDHYCVAAVEGETVLGFIYYARNEMTDRSWYIYWIAVDRAQQGKGLGKELLRHAEDAIRKLNGRLLLIETSGLPFYEPTRRFYQRHDYEVAAVVGDFYADGDDMVVFRKRF